MAGKGDKRRPATVSQEEIDSNYNQIFGNKRERGRFFEHEGKWLPEDEYNLLLDDKEQSHTVLGDIEPFMSPSGEYITGRKQWRNHLAKTDTVEMGHSDRVWAEKNRVNVIESRQRQLSKARKERIIYEMNHRGLTGTEA